jgi:hypothetical protein
MPSLLRGLPAAGVDTIVAPRDEMTRKRVPPPGSVGVGLPLPAIACWPQAAAAKAPVNAGSPPTQPDKAAAERQFGRPSLYFAASFLCKSVQTDIAVLGSTALSPSSMCWMIPFLSMTMFARCAH